MPTELWDLEAWPSPSAEAVLRGRVRRRVRGILRWRVAAVSMVVVSALTAVVSDLPGGKTPRRVEVYDSRIVDAEAPPMPGVGATPPAADAGGLGTTGARASVPKGVAVPASVTGSGTAPAHAWPAGPVVPDATGDATYQAGCYSFYNVDCPGDARVKQESYRMFDLTSVAVPCSDRTLAVRFNIADLDRPTGDGDGMKPTAGAFWATLWFDDEGRSFMNFHVRRTIDTDELVAAGQFTFRDSTDEGYTGSFQPTARREGDTLLVEVGWADLEAAYQQFSPEGRPSQPGMAMSVQASSAAIFETGVANAQMLHAADEIEWTLPVYPYRFCEG